MAKNKLNRKIAEDYVVQYSIGATVGYMFIAKHDYDRETLI